jgi:uncharacterized protein (DUF2147 family)
MKKFALAATFILGFASSAIAQDALEGTWQTAKDDNGNYGHIEVTPCGTRLCGVLIRSFDSSGAALASENIGKQIIWDMKAKGGGNYGNGKVWSPDRDKTYNSRMTLTGDAVTVKGCVLGICRDGGNWTRVN